MDEPTPEAALVRLMTWLSPAFPVGAFTYSHGLEWAVEEGSVTDEASLLAQVDRAWAAILAAGGGGTGAGSGTGARGGNGAGGGTEPSG